MSAARELMERTQRFELAEVEPKTNPGLPVWEPDEVEEPTIKVVYETCGTCQGMCRISFGAGQDMYGNDVTENVKCPTCEGFGAETTAVSR